MRFILSRPQPKLNTSALLGGIGVGAALMYYLDPNRGARRRGLLRDKLVHAASVTGDAVGATKRDLANRARGLAAEARALGNDEEVEDDVLEARIRAELGRVVSHPAAIEVKADDGRVTLSGDVLASEASRLMRRVSRVRGVDEVHSELRVFHRANDVASLQGGEELEGGEFELRQENWAPAARFLTSIAGGALAMYGVARRDKFGSAVGLAGLALLTRGGTDRELGRVAGGRGGRNGIHVLKTVNIDAPNDKVWAFLTEWERFPEWMTHVRAVRSLGGSGAVGERTRWEVDGPTPGTTIEWNAITTRLESNRLIAWKSEEGEPIRQAGRIRLASNARGGTRLHIELQYNPPGGYLGHAIAALFQRDPKHQMDDDLARLKTVIETARPPRDAAGRSKGHTRKETAPAESPAPLEVGPQ
jgi:uncharacterized membrane protein